MTSFQRFIIITTYLYLLLAPLYFWTQYGATENYGLILTHKSTVGVAQIFPFSEHYDCPKIAFQ